MRFLRECQAWLGLRRRARLSWGVRALVASCLMHRHSQAPVKGRRPGLSGESIQVPVAPECSRHRCLPGTGCGDRRE